ncbi:hypothetical protein Q5530_05500 [Saccharothrix sp. BKS2]|uniref:hypothetical protein n=1 Tax=Saccharothrix sp. BKS2 TaxID=3064400 RepID=UPI0039E91201
MDFGDVPAWVAAVVALGSMVVAVVAAVFSSRQVTAAKTQAAAALQQADEAKKAREAAEAGVEQAQRSAKAAEESAAEARKANEFMREKDAREQTERDETAVAEASTVRGALTNMGGVALKVTNDGTKPVYDLELESVEAVGNPTFTWRFRPTVGTQRAVRETLTAGGSHTYYIDFTDEDGAEHRAPGEGYHFTISFTDASGQRWRRVNSGTPVRVTAEETSEATSRDAVTPVAASPSDEGLHLLVLRALYERLQDRRPVNVKTLPDELGLKDHHVQQALRSLHEDGMIEVLTGDDLIVSVPRLTRQGGLALLQNRR